MGLSFLALGSFFNSQRHVYAGCPLTQRIEGDTVVTSLRRQAVSKPGGRTSTTMHRFKERYDARRCTCGLRGLLSCAHVMHATGHSTLLHEFGRFKPSPAEDSCRGRDVHRAQASAGNMTDMIKRVQDSRQLGVFESPAGSSAGGAASRSPATTPSHARAQPSRPLGNCPTGRERAGRARKGGGCRRAGGG